MSDYVLIGDSYDSLPKFDLIPKLSNIPINLLPQIDFKYYTINELNNQVSTSLESLDHTFSLFHCNIRSLSANWQFDNFAF